MKPVPLRILRVLFSGLPFVLCAVPLAAASLIEVRVHPAAISLEGSGDRQSFIVQAL
ncbi:MAG: hypothetical protein RLZZ221_2217, partial [Verrucomicrobiota bacterium]